MGLESNVVYGFLGFYSGIVLFNLAKKKMKKTTDNSLGKVINAATTAVPAVPAGPDFTSDPLNKKYFTKFNSFNYANKNLISFKL